MLGSLLAGCEEAPGDVVFVNGKTVQNSTARKRSLAPCSPAATLALVLEGPVLPDDVCPTTSLSPKDRGSGSVPWPPGGRRINSSVDCALRWAAGAESIAELQENGRCARSQRPV